MEKIRFAKLRGHAIIPTKRLEDAGYDIYACIDVPYMIINPHQTQRIPTGIASAFSSDYYFQIHERGSTGSRGIGQRCGVIDSGYRSEWFLTITNHNDIPLCLKCSGTILPFDELTWNGIIYDLGKALAQAVFLPVPRVNIEEVPYDELCKIESERMFGNSGSSHK